MVRRPAAVRASAGGPASTTDPVNVAFFGLAFTAALNPKLRGADLLIIENRLPKALFICFLTGGVG